VGFWIQVVEWEKKKMGEKLKREEIASKVKKREQQCQIGKQWQR
jgi:hypothetical protein